MNSLKTLVSTLLAIPLIAMSMQLVSITSASAAPGTADLSVNIWTFDSGGQVLATTVCNNGDETVTEFLWENEGVGYSQHKLVIFPSSPNAASDSGSIDETTHVWTGELQNTQCLNIAQISDITGALGSQATSTVTVSNSILLGGIPNDETGIDSNNSYTAVPLIIALQPDLAMSTRLLTSGGIQNDTDLTYEVTISNIGDGPVPQGVQMNVLFIIPADTTYGSFEDPDLDDALAVPGCISGPPSSIGASVTNPGTLVMCEGNTTEEMPSGSSYKLLFRMNAAASFTSGQTEVLGAIGGSDRDTLLIQAELFANRNPFDLEINNIVRLQYNSDAVQVTMSPCTGQGTTTTDGTACFMVHFSKLIYSPSFTLDSLVLSSGSVSGFSKVDDYNWKVNIEGITPGSTFTLELAENGAIDYNANLNDTHVLGINTIRYEITDTGRSNGGTNPGAATNGALANGTLASGTLANTGLNSILFLFATILISVGYGLIKISRRKQFA